MPQTRIVVLTGESGAGKTRLCERLIEVCQTCSIDVAGILTPPRFENGEKIGIDAQNIRSGERRPLAERERGSNGPSVGRWHFRPDALLWGAQILERSFPCSLFVLDELGPLELERGEGWANGIDLLRRKDARAIVVVRPGLLEKLNVQLNGIDRVSLAVTHTNQDQLLVQLAAFARGEA